MLKATYKKYILNFKRASGTSRGILKTKETWFLIISDGVKKGIGECGLFRGLSADDVPNYEEKLKWVCNNINLGCNKLLNKCEKLPSIQFGIEQAFISLYSSDLELFKSSFTKGETVIPINGLIWMGNKGFMKSQIKEKLANGFSCIKMKIGAIDFTAELELLKFIRSQFSSKEIELRVDANGAFKPSEALEKLKRLSEFDLHSIEQPIKQGQLQEMAKLCENTPLPIALDEELIGVFSVKEKEDLIKIVQPQYIILKPSLIGGFKGSEQWISIAKQYKKGWWVTSALESNIGLNAIAQWTHTLQNKLPQGLGTGNLFTNNFKGPLKVKNGALAYNKKKSWVLNEFFTAGI